MPELINLQRFLEESFHESNVFCNWEEQVEYISPTTLEAAKTLSRVASQKPKSIDKGRRYKRRKETKGKKVVTSLDFQEEVSTGYAERVNIGSIKVSTVSGKVRTVSRQVSTDSIKKSIPSPDKGQREGKAPMIIEKAPKKTKERILQEGSTDEDGKLKAREDGIDIIGMNGPEMSLRRMKIKENNSMVEVLCTTTTNGYRSTLSNRHMGLASPGANDSCKDFSCPQNNLKSFNYNIHQEASNETLEETGSSQVSKRLFFGNLTVSTATSTPFMISKSCINLYDMVLRLESLGYVVVLREYAFDYELYESWKELVANPVRIFGASIVLMKASKKENFFRIARKPL
ncbi:hypothetical protein Tco_0922552 [Tanacetum coccineum]|uniref:Uncharacterized protein n=1 Tax=Tanacetum coccineum TaxID=301880 RepID=A0ABQ5D0V6_9ASTR